MGLEGQTPMGTAKPSLGQLYPLNLRGGAVSGVLLERWDMQGRRKGQGKVAELGKGQEITASPGGRAWKGAATAQSPRARDRRIPSSGLGSLEGNRVDLCREALGPCTSLICPGAQCGLTLPPAHQTLSSESPGSMPLTRKYFSKRTLEVLKVPMVSISITVLKALKDRALAGHRKFPAAPEPQRQAGQGWERCQGPSVPRRVRDNVCMPESTWTQPW